MILTNQFHDIIPGSSIHEVYEDSRRDYEKVRKIGEEVAAEAEEAMTETYYEAAVLDGASKWQQIKYITLPLLKPVITILLIMAVGGIFKSDFGLFYQLPQDSGPLYPVTNVLDTYIFPCPEDKRRAGHEFRGSAVPVNRGIYTYHDCQQACIQG